jgi:hypothetical protein
MSVSTPLLRRLAGAGRLPKRPRAPNVFDHLYKYKNYGVGTTFFRKRWQKYWADPAVPDCFVTITRVKPRSRVRFALDLYFGIFKYSPGQPMSLSSCITWCWVVAFAKLKCWWEIDRPFFFFLGVYRVPLETPERPGVLWYGRVSCFTMVRSAV